MKLIIDIPKSEYDKICLTMLHTSGGNPNFYFESKIANGIPLPKGHGRLVDADAYARRYRTTNINGRIGEEYVIAPTIIEADKAESEE